jgi:hypothetical protein
MTADLWLAAGAGFLVGMLFAAIMVRVFLIGRQIEDGIDEALQAWSRAKGTREFTPRQLLSIRAALKEDK